jgi:acetoin utilization deacetylase AcuC-like enzyme
LTGAKTLENLTEAFENIYPHLLEFRKKNVIVTQAGADGRG